MENINEALEWRYATKQFDSTKKLSEEQVQSITEAMRLAPTSYGLQSWKAIIVTNPEIRTQLRAAAWDQSQVTDASHFIVLAVRKDINEAFVDEYMQHIAKVRQVGVETLEGFAGMIKGSFQGKSPEQLRDWATHQAYIALGFGLETAALNKIDACPMEGFDRKQFDEILGLEKMGLESKVALAIGHRSSDDDAASWTKVRFAPEDLFVNIA